MLKEISKYSLLALPLAFVGLPIYINAPELYARTYQIPITQLGLSLLILRLFDAILDPIIGRISDMYAKQRPKFIVFGLILLVLGFYLLFNPHASSISWFASAVIISTTGYSIANINYLALGGLWHIKSSERSKVTATREFFGLIGLLISAVLANLPNTNYLEISLGLIPITLIASFSFLNWHQHVKLYQNQATKIKLTLNQWSIKFYLIYFLNSFASSIPAVLVLFFIKDNLADNAAGFYLLTYFLSAALAMPIWHYLAQVLTKIQAWAFGMILASLSFVWAILLTPATAKYFFLICIGSGIALGADLALPPAILADKIITDDNTHQASQHFAILNFLTKLTMALAAGLSLPILAKLGYQVGQSSIYLSYAYALIPAIIKFLTAFGLFIWSKYEIKTSGA